MPNKKVEIENKSPVTIHGLKSNAKVMVEIDNEGTIIDKLFRRRVADKDECIVLTDKAGKIVAELKKKVATKKEAAQKKTEGGSK